jgi:arylformamidase
MKTRGAKRPGWIDVSVPLRTGMAHWPDNPPVVVERTMDLEQGDACTVSRLSMGAHTGTHMDAPSHFVAGGPSLDALPFDAVIGRARVVAIRNPRAVTVEELRRHAIRRGERLLFRTRNSGRCWGADAFVEDFVYVSADAARYLAERGVRLVGVDYLSVGGFVHDGQETHEALLGAGIWVVEGLDLSKVRPGPVDLVCLPLRLSGSEGAPARAIVRERRPARR